MKPLETATFAATLLLVPALAWWTGRAMGRRDMAIAGVIIAGSSMALIPHLARVAILAAYGARPFADEFLYQLSRTFDAPEVGLFFVTFGVFMAMLGWTATPVFVAKS